MTDRRSPGALEAAVMRVLWSAEDPMAAAEVREALAADESDVPAFTTVVTVLNRLCAKGRVDKSVSAGGRWVFAAVESESTHAVQGMLTALLGATDRGATLLGFAGSLQPQDVRMLRGALGGADRLPAKE